MKILLSAIILLMVLSTGCLPEYSQNDTNDFPAAFPVLAEDDTATRIMEIEANMATLEGKVTTLEEKTKTLERDVADLKAKVPVPKTYLTPDGRIPVTKEDWLSIPEFVVTLPGYTPKPTVIPVEVKRVLTTVNIEVSVSEKDNGSVNIFMHYYDQNGQEITDEPDQTEEYQSIKNQKMDFAIIADGKQIDGGTFKSTPRTKVYSFYHLKKTLKACTGETVTFKFTKYYNNQTFPCEVTLPRSEMIQ